jgi:hypothetical protein
MMSCDEYCDKSYCQKHNPKVARIMSITNPDLDISLDELERDFDRPATDPIPVKEQPAGVALDALGNAVVYHGSYAQSHVPCPPGPIGSAGPAGATVISSDGTSSFELREPKEIFRTVETKEDLPETGAKEGQLMLVQEEEILHIWDGEEWANLGDVARELRLMRNNAHNRRAEAIAASRRKRDERAQSRNQD